MLDGILCGLTVIVLSYASSHARDGNRLSEHNHWFWVGNLLPCPGRSSTFLNTLAKQTTMDMYLGRPSAPFHYRNQILSHSLLTLVAYRMF